MQLHVQRSKFNEWTLRAPTHRALGRVRNDSAAAILIGRNRHFARKSGIGNPSVTKRGCFRAGAFELCAAFA
jgi:hypothetical protein